MALTFDVDVTHNAGKVLKTNLVHAPTSSNGTTYGAGSADDVLKSNGEKTYWGHAYSSLGITHAQVPHSNVYDSIGWNETNYNRLFCADAPKYLTGTYTLASDSWSSTTPPTITLNIAGKGITASSLVQISLDSTATADQIDAAANAKLMGTAQAANSITITAYGTKPTVNIPILVTNWG